MIPDFIPTVLLYPSRHKKISSEHHSTNLWINMLSTVSLPLIILNFIPAHASTEFKLRDLDTLATMLPGCYSNAEQYYKHVKRGLPPEKRHFLLKAEIYKMAEPMFNDTLTFYFQDFTQSSAEPFRSGFYSFAVEPKLNVVRMKTLKLKNNAYIVGAFKKSGNFTLANEMAAQVLKTSRQESDSLRTYSACDMFWKRLGDSTFVGITGPLCLGALGTDQVRIGVSMTLTKERLLLTESWYKLSDGTRITEVKVPYILQKLRVPKITKHNRRKPSRTSSSPERMSNDVYSSDNDVSSLKFTHPRIKNGVNTQFQEPGKKNSARKSRKRPHQDRSVKHRILRNFQQVAAALTSGHDVYFRVELSACAIPEQVKFERLSFGGMIRNFVYVRQEGFRNERKDYIYFLSHKTVMGSQGPEFISRQLTLYREGRVKVEIITKFSDPTKVKQGYAFECKLYNDQKGYGGVKLALDPTSHIKRINSFSTLATTVDQGRDLHIVANLARCRGSMAKPWVVMGSQMSNYDFVNGGKTLEIFIPFVQTITSGQDDEATSKQGFMGQILKNGDVILTLISNSQSKDSLDNVYRLSPAYHCSLSSRNAVNTNDENEHSVKLFSSK